MALPTPLIYINNGSGNVNLTAGQQVVVSAYSQITIGLQSTAGVVSVTYQIRGPGTVYWSGEATFYPSPTNPNLTWTFQLPTTPTIYQITTVVNDGNNTTSCTNSLQALTASNINIPSGTGIFHITGGVADSAASSGSANQIYQEDSAANNQAWVTVYGDSTLGANGLSTTTGIQSVPVSNVAPANAQVLSSNGSAIYWANSLPAFTPVSKGGTNAATLTAHAVLLGEGTNTVAFAGPNAATGTNALPLISQGASADPIFAALSLAGTGITGTLPYTHGGTGLSNIGTNTQVLTVVGNVPAWANAPSNNFDGNVGLLIAGSPQSYLITSTLNIPQWSAAPMSPNGAVAVIGLQGGNPGWSDGGTSSNGCIFITQAGLHDWLAPGNNTAILTFANTAFGPSPTWTAGGTNNQVLTITNNVVGWSNSTPFAGLLPVSQGGTNATSLTLHSVLLGEGTGTVKFAGPNATSGLPLLSQGSSADPTFAAVSLTGSGISGVLPVPSGGTNAATLTSGSVLIGNGTGTIVQVTGASNTYVLKANTSGNPYFGASPTMQYQSFTASNSNVSVPAGVASVYIWGFGGGGGGGGGGNGAANTSAVGMGGTGGGAGAGALPYSTILNTSTAGDSLNISVGGGGTGGTAATGGSAGTSSSVFVLSTTSGFYMPGASGGQGGTTGNNSNVYTSYFGLIALGGSPATVGGGTSAYAPAWLSAYPNNGTVFNAVTPGSGGCGGQVLGNAQFITPQPGADQMGVGLQISYGAGGTAGNNGATHTAPGGGAGGGGGAGPGPYGAGGYGGNGGAANTSTTGGAGTTSGSTPLANGGAGGGGGGGGGNGTAGGTGASGQAGASGLVVVGWVA